MEDSDAEAGTGLAVEDSDAEAGTGLAVEDSDAEAGLEAAKEGLERIWPRNQQCSSAILARQP